MTLDFNKASEMELVLYFKQKFEAIPSRLWISGEFSNEENKCCALGHCGDRDQIPSPKEAIALSSLFHKYCSLSVQKVNDSKSDHYPQPTPRARILAALDDIEGKIGEGQ